MDFSQLLQEKTKARDEIKNHYHLPKRSKTLVALYFSDSKMTEEIYQGLSVLPVNFIVVGTTIQESNIKNIAHIKSLDQINILGIDAFLCDCTDIQLEKYMESGTVPIVNENNYLGKILSEFSAARGEGNAYLYEQGSYWAAYYALIRYLENLKFPYDNRNLVKNVVGG